MHRARAVALAIVLASAGACSSNVEDVTQALSPSRSVTPSPTSSTAPGGRPAIVVRTPRPGDEVVSPLPVSGSANVFEATVAIRILGTAGAELAATVATASCGSGCRGRFAADLAFFVDQRQQGVIEVFEPSAEDGSPTNLVQIEVVLVPGA